MQDVVVIGAGVSGCACAATLASAGVGVTLMSTALDHLGEPSFGPEIMQEEGAHNAPDVLASLPGGLGEAWLGAACSARDGSFMTIDRRRVSLETKRLLECSRGLHLRQGLVVGLSAAASSGTQDGSDDARVCVHTAFGEDVLGRAAVVAVGLGLGRTHDAGGLQGGGAEPSEGRGPSLLSALQRLGARFETGRAEIGVRLGLGGASDEDVWDALANCGWEGPAGEAWPRPELVACERAWYGPMTIGRGGRHSDNELPGITVQGAGPASEQGVSSPYDDSELWHSTALAVGSASGVAIPVVVGDGVATRELFVRPGWRCSALFGEDERGAALGNWGAVVARAARSLEGMVVVNAGEAGAVTLPGVGGGAVWVTGRCAGATGYLESLQMGVRTGEAIARSLQGRGGANG